jgi:hypothetical protein
VKRGRLLVSDAEIEAINAVCIESGAGATVALDVVLKLDEARGILATIDLILAGQVIPSLATCDDEFCASGGHKFKACRHGELTTVPARETEAVYVDRAITEALGGMVQS